MKKWVVLIFAAAVLAFVWQIANRLSADAIGMALGVLFGVLAGVPAALLVMASSRRREERESVPTRQQMAYGLPAPHAPQAPIIVLAGNGYPGQGPQYQQGYPPVPPDRLALPAPHHQSTNGERKFRVVGEKEEWIDEW